MDALTTYDDNGNLTRKTDARGVYVDYIYDALNRATSRTYSDGTPAVTYTYDSASVANSKGRLTSASSSVSATNTTAFDAQGKIVSGNQITDGQTYSMSYGYNLAGGLTSLTYPTGRVIETKYDSAGRVAGIRDQQSGIYYAGAIGTDATNRLQYSPSGSVSVMKLGNGLWEHTNFNSRLQPTEIGLGTSATNSSTVGLTYNYGTTNNNGNILTIAYAGGGLSYTQSFGYDSLNRITTSSESGSSWSQTNSYDRYGNRSTLGGVLTFSASNNRITNGGYVYDTAGNLTNDGTQSFAFDGENKIKTVNGETDVYRYDADGNRVRKNFTSGEKVRMVYSGSQMIAEYDLSNGSLKKEYVYGPKGLLATIEAGAGTKYMTTDYLGTPRVITSSSGTVISRHDYMPFGEELGAGIGGRTSGMGFSVADGQRQKFTSKERDIETGLDYFGARHYAPTQGRFTGVDPGPFMVVDPQSWNRYLYVQNNPLKFIDPTGRKLELSGDKAQELVDYLKKKTGLDLKYDSKTGKVTVGKGKRAEAGTSKELAKTVKDVIGNDATAKFNVSANATFSEGGQQGEVFVDDGENAWNAKNRTANVDIADIQSLDKQAPEFGIALVGHFLIEGLEVRKLGGNYYNTGEPGAHDKGLEVESRILTEATGVKQGRREQSGTGDPSFSFVYTSIQYDITLKSDSSFAVSKTTRASAPPKKK